ncbi:hypothetical protein TNIN_260381 [Trichonephila inaurata madagascariensis]|uniref:Uncharacterized protein n=1 Tax=Trichonephila inaurata madagascariensis TaxID=2747483 RepID=A0A8X6XY11_9ARAC|nr:hypothetical protein TNIN_395951 [Trichonephila inaurata madagascariensis]GFY68159.1 hypothetical protein TNIN_260381 [Trichonephila inaurata madagascariensis]
MPDLEGKNLGIKGEMFTMSQQGYATFAAAATQSLNYPTNQEDPSHPNGRGPFPTLGFVENQVMISGFPTKQTSHTHLGYQAFL